MTAVVQLNDPQSNKNIIDRHSQAKRVKYHRY